MNVGYNTCALLGVWIKNVQKCASAPVSPLLVDGSHSITDTKNRAVYPSCSGALAPGLAADMHFKDDVIAFIGPACAFALEPVARLAAYWNTPIITGMGDQFYYFSLYYTRTRSVITKTKCNDQEESFTLHHYTGNNRKANATVLCEKPGTQGTVA
ncbi:hypothetical protein ACJJTC_001162 [Scirpophaga incertulas]